LGLKQKVAETQVWRSIFRHGYPNTPRNRALAALSNVFLHLHPVKARKSGIRLSFTWCMGGITFFLFLLETITGVLLMFYYRPTIEYAYNDIIALREHVPLGIMRELHRWGAHMMVLAVWLHMLRVFLTGSYKPPREFNWNIGVILLLLTLLLSFTGYLLPWDQLALWAVTVGTNMMGYTPVFGSSVKYVLLGSNEISGETLLRWYVLHVLLLPFVIVIFMAVHFWRVRKDGGISGPL
jgi:quinol-cytochrome oxidoreductase complex cytochrome b subunit